MHTRAAEYYSMPTPGGRLRTEYAVYHATRANQPERALSALNLGIAQAKREGDEATAEILEQQALKISANTPELSEHRNEIAESLGDQFAAQGEYEQAARSYQQADRESASTLLRAKGAITALAVDASQAVSLIARLTPGIPLETDHDLRWRLEAAQSWGLALQGRTYDAIRHSRNALATLSTLSGLGSARTLTRGILGMALYYHGDEEEARPHLESSRGGYAARGDEDGVTFLDQVLSGMPRESITHAWLDLVLRPLLPESPD
jgi:tetratricopeptide (TPR) repeat protein